ncbi:hypothetical protein DICPUDRAFT_94325 [Dictyostelium purpureum]|uniref:leucine--tRNA ligase n=1 Tax=Dictyostelium purpureum TaxID=5786 RepID=F0ZI59_DICPU|nr:uncharacterized protein DICPUDRAFT_94325 [Dictyostelium purpureum]EGC36349.1 hypothetical protein DICPUDRAFT_94325 [Dictyostelium purpureum]|eukprot:XP_003287103.1 hypothetical protein DICPUDRAFT_94325 [Dictyostelium purpureum]
MYNLYKNILNKPVKILPKCNITNINNNNNNGFYIKSFFSTNNNPKTPSEKEKFYSLSQFPYPSGNLHMGHVRVYSISDCIARLKRMQGYDVIHPMGWDAFGLPAENAAIDKKVSPSYWTNLNINTMKDQLKRLDLHFDWDRELSTCNKDYYRWTQDIFLKLFKSGLAYRKSATVNWDPIDQTVLANEQVDAQGRSWRSNAIVEKKEMKQWFFKITAMADRLHDDLDTLPGWSDEIKNMQKEWIGRSHGHLITFKFIKPSNSGANLEPLSDITVFTTRAETIFGASFVSISPQHKEVEIIKKYLSKDRLAEFEDYLAKVEELKKKNGFEEDEKNLMAFNTGLTLLQPITNNQVPLVFSNFVHADYGTGAVMGVPSHNRADNQVAKQLSLPLFNVIEPPSGKTLEELGDCYDESSGYLINSGEFTGKSFKEFISHMESKELVQKQTNYRIHDWLISRQRYWGTPIPIIICEKCGDVPVPESELPVVLPTDIEFTGKGNLLNQLEDWKKVKCPCCGNSNATRETDTMDTFVDSSWYYLRFLDNKNDNAMFKPEIVNKYMPVDVYVGGIEHAILHLLYSRFFTKFLKDQDLIQHSEPFKVLLAQGLVKSPTYRDEVTNKPIHPNDLEWVKGSKQPINKLTGNKVNITIEKMSKSKLNGIDPNEMIDKYGSDTLKSYILFKAPPQNSLDWDSDGIEGCRKWLKRVESLTTQFVEEFSLESPITQDKFTDKQKKELKEMEFEAHSTIDRVTESIDKHSFNTGISALMQLSNTLQKIQLKSTKEYYSCLRLLNLLLFPYAPKYSEINWKLLIDDIKNKDYGVGLEEQSCGSSNDSNIHNQKWPKPSSKALTRDSISLVVQFDGKTRGLLEDIPVSVTDFESLVKESSKFSNRFTDKTVDKVFIGQTKTGFSINFIFKK